MIGSDRQNYFWCAGQNGHLVLCRTFQFPVGHFATCCPANRELSAGRFVYLYFVFPTGNFLHMDYCRTKCPTMLELSAGHVKIVLDMSGIFGDHCDRQWYSLVSVQIDLFINLSLRLLSYITQIRGHIRIRILNRKP